MKKQKVWVKSAINERIMKEQELYIFTPEELVEKLKEAWNAGYERHIFEVSSHWGIFGRIPPIEDEFIKNQNIEL